MAAVTFLTPENHAPALHRMTLFDRLFRGGITPDKSLLVGSLPMDYSHGAECPRYELDRGTI